MKTTFPLWALVLFLAQACASSSHEQALQEKRSDIYFDAGTEALEKQQYTEALSSLMTAAKLNPNSAAVWNNLGYAYAGKGESKKAEESWKKALALQPSNSDARLNLGALYLQEKRFPEAEHLLLEVQRDLIYEKSYQASYNLALLYQQTNRSNLMEIQLRRVLASNPSYCQAWFLLGKIQKDRGSYAEAATSLNKSVSGMCFHNPSAHYEIASLYLKSHDIARAKSKLLEVIQFFPETPWAKKAEITLNMIR